MLLILLIICYLLFINNEYFINTKPNIVRQLYNMMYIVDVLFTKNNILYWVDGGTLLGAVRHKGIIPWDDDIDIQVMDKDFNKIKLLDLSKYNLELVDTWFGFKIFPKNGKFIKGFKWKYPAIDIFVMVKRHNKLVYKFPKAQRLFGHCFSYTNDIFPIVRYKFGPIYVNGINNKYSYLDRCYGLDWRTHAYQQYDHENEKHIKKVKVKLTANDINPIY